MKAAHVGQWAFGTSKTVWRNDGEEVSTSVDIAGEVVIQREVKQVGVGTAYEQRQAQARCATIYRSRERSPKKLSGGVGGVL